MMWPAYVAKKKKTNSKIDVKRLVHNDLFAPSLNRMSA